MLITDWFLKTFCYGKWLKRVVNQTADALHGKWIFVSLDDENDCSLLEVASKTGASYDCFAKIRLHGFLVDQVNRCRTSPSAFEEICNACKEHLGDARLFWDDNTESLVMEVTSTVTDPDTWFHQTRDVIPVFIGRQLEVEVSSLSMFMECQLRTV